MAEEHSRFTTKPKKITSTGEFAWGGDSGWEDIDETENVRVENGRVQHVSIPSEVTDQFDDSEFNTSKWVFVNRGGDASYDESGGVLQLLYGPDRDDRPVIRTQDKIVADGDVGDDLSISTRGKTLSNGGHIHLIGWWDGELDGTYSSPVNAVYAKVSSPSDSVALAIAEGGKRRTLDSVSPIPVDETVFHDWKLELVGNFTEFSYTISIDGDQVSTGTGSFNPSNAGVYAGYAGRETTADTEFDSATILTEL
jgi:hypothetical protein